MAFVCVQTACAPLFRQVQWQSRRSRHFRHAHAYTQMYTHTHTTPHVSLDLSHSLALFVAVWGCVMPRTTFSVGGIHSERRHGKRLTQTQKPALSAGERFHLWISHKKRRNGSGVRKLLAIAGKLRQCTYTHSTPPRNKRRWHA